MLDRSSRRSTSTGSAGGTLSSPPCPPSSQVWMANNPGEAPPVLDRSATGGPSSTGSAGPAEKTTLLRRVLRALNTINIGQGFEAGLAIVLLAIILDRFFRIDEEGRS